MSNESLTADAGNGPSSPGTVLSESILLAQLVAFWGVCAALPTVYLILLGPTGIFRAVTLVILGVVLVLGMANVLLYVIARGIALGTSGRV